VESSICIGPEICDNNATVKGYYWVTVVDSDHTGLTQPEAKTALTKREEQNRVRPVFISSRK
jgi:hypothetical protein